MLAIMHFGGKTIGNHEKSVVVAYVVADIGYQTGLKNIIL